jgi:uncharacterized tellurite resistance protein B-like protein
MLTQITTFFERHILPQGADSQQEQDRPLRLAVAALLLEMTRMDDEVQAEECSAVEAAIRANFGLTAEETRDLVDLAEAQRREATDYFQFTSLINQHYSPEQRVQVVEQLWQVAYADAELHRYEEHLVRKVAELLHVPHGAFIAAKHRASGGN